MRPVVPHGPCSGLEQQTTIVINRVLTEPGWNGAGASLRLGAFDQHSLPRRANIVTIPCEKAYESGFEDMPRRVPDLTKVKNLVGYKPRV